MTAPVATSRPASSPARRFRRSRDVAVVPLAVLTTAQRDRLAALADLTAMSAVLVPRGAADDRLRIVDAPTAELLAALEVPRPVTAELLARSASTAADLAGLVLAGVVDVETGDRFVSGPAAQDLVAAPAPARGTTPLARLSDRVLTEVVRRPPVGAARLAAALYLAGRHPVTPALHQRWPGPAAVLAELGPDAVPDTHRRVVRDARPSGWLLWHDVVAPDLPAGGRVPKLYVSPTPEHATAVLRTLGPLLAAQRPPVFKLGADAYGLCRPDKLVVYFRTVADLRAFAAAAAPLLTGTPVHGVPFTAAPFTAAPTDDQVADQADDLTDDGLLSWGIDPPRGVGRGGPTERESWRVWITGRLADLIVDARRVADAGAVVDPVGSALARLALDGVDTATWAPASGVWEPAPPAPDQE